MNRIIVPALARAGLLLGAGRLVEGYERVNDNIRHPATFDVDLAATAAVGVKTAVDGLTVTEYGDEAMHKTVFDMANMAITMRDAQQGGGQQIYTFPTGRIYVVGAYAGVQMTTHSVLADTLNSGVTCNWGVGTDTQANATLATTEQNIVPVTAWTSGTTIDVANTKTYAALASPAVFDGTTTAKALFMNLAVAGATDIDANASILVNGRIEVVWSLIGAR